MRARSFVIKRLKRADGHLQTIIEMIEGGRPYAQLAQQLEAVERATENAKKALIHDYIAQALERAAQEPEPERMGNHAAAQSDRQISLTDPEETRCALLHSRRRFYR